MFVPFSITTFWHWSTEVLAPNIHQHGQSGPNLILGPVRLKQTRSVQGMSVFILLHLDCSGGARFQQHVA